MRTQMQQASLEAYASIPLQRREEEVLNVIRRLQPCDNLKIAKELGYQINQVTGRTNGLMKKGLITDYDKAKNENGRMAIRWITTSKQLGLF